MRYPASFRSSCPGVEIVLVTNNFPPIRGGSASVYANLARCAAGEILVLAPTTDYTDGLPLIGWREHDRCAPYPVKRLPLLRTTVSGRKRASLAGWIAWDLSIRLRLCFRLLIVILRDGPRVVCVGELLASGWLFRVLRWVPGVRTIAYVHGEEITTDDVYDRFHHRALRSLQDCDRVVVVSRFTQTKVETLLGHASAPILKLIQN